MYIDRLSLDDTGEQPRESQCAAGAALKDNELPLLVVLLSGTWRAAAYVFPLSLSLSLSPRECLFSARGHSRLWFPHGAAARIGLLIFPIPTGGGSCRLPRTHESERACVYVWIIRFPRAVDVVTRRERADARRNFRRDGDVASPFYCAPLLRSRCLLVLLCCLARVIRILFDEREGDWFFGVINTANLPIFNLYLEIKYIYFTSSVTETSQEVRFKVTLSRRNPSSTYSPSPSVTLKPREL